MDAERLRRLGRWYRWAASGRATLANARCPSRDASPDDSVRSFRGATTFAGRGPQRSSGREPGAFSPAFTSPAPLLPESRPPARCGPLRRGAAGLGLFFVPFSAAAHWIATRWKNVRLRAPPPLEPHRGAGRRGARRLGPCVALSRSTFCRPSDRRNLIGQRSGSRSALCSPSTPRCCTPCTIAATEREASAASGGCRVGSLYVVVQPPPGGSQPDPPPGRVRCSSRGRRAAPARRRRRRRDARPAAAARPPGSTAVLFDPARRTAVNARLETVSAGAPARPLARVSRPGSSPIDTASPPTPFTVWHGLRRASCASCRSASTRSVSTASSRLRAPPSPAIVARSPCPRSPPRSASGPPSSARRRRSFPESRSRPRRATSALSCRTAA